MAKEEINLYDYEQFTFLPKSFQKTNVSDTCEKRVEISQHDYNLCLNYFFIAILPSSKYIFQSWWKTKSQK